jgi:hypothetical protein
VTHSEVLTDSNFCSFERFNPGCGDLQIQNEFFGKVACLMLSGSSVQVSCTVLLMERLERSQPPWLLAMKDDFLDLGDEPGSKHLLNASIAVPSEILLHPHDFQKNVVHFFCVTVQVLYLNLVLPSASDRWNCNSLGRDKMPYAEVPVCRCLQNLLHLLSEVHALSASGSYCTVAVSDLPAGLISAG